MEIKVLVIFREFANTNDSAIICDPNLNDDQIYRKVNELRHTTIIRVEMPEGYEFARNALGGFTLFAPDGAAVSNVFANCTRTEKVSSLIFTESKGLMAGSTHHKVKIVDKRGIYE